VLGPKAFTSGRGHPQKFMLMLCRRNGRCLITFRLITHYAIFHQKLGGFVRRVLRHLP